MHTREVIRRWVRDHPLLESLSEPERRFVEDIGISVTVEPGDYFIREGEANPDLYLICTGSGELLKTWIQRAVAWVGFLLLTLPVAIMIRKIGFPIREVLDLHPNLRRCVTEGLVIAAAIVAAVLLLTSGLVRVPGFTTAYATLSVG